MALYKYAYYSELLLNGAYRFLYSESSCKQWICS